MDELDPGLYTVAWLAPLDIEARAALHLLDHRHRGRFPMSRGNDYVFQAGDAGGHNIIIATLPAGQPYGTGSAAALAGQVKSFFPNLWFGLLVGVAAGLPSPSREIHLGDVLVGVSEGDSAGLIAYDLGKETEQNGFQLLRSGHVLAETETVVRSAIGSIKLQSPYDSEVLEPYYRQIMDKRHPNGTFRDPGQDDDILYQVLSDGTGRLALRGKRPDAERTRVWYGSIGSGEKLMRNAQIRDKLRDEHNIIGLEMEAAGTMNCLPVGVIRGVCDYGDGHKSKGWQPYAAAMAAAYARAILAEIPPKRAARRNELAIQSAPQPPDDKKVKDLLESLRFDQIDFRRENIKEAHIDTCGWLPEKSEYRDWLDPSKLGNHHGFLWIKGKPGVGKSTLMKFILSNAQNQLKDKVIISFFFNARGDLLEKSTIGMYRSLLWQLLQNVPYLETIFASTQSLAMPGMSRDWSVELLKTLFEKAVQQLGQTSLMCLIDALDECDEQQVRDMTSFFDRLGNMTTSSGIAFRVCFASRHYPYITISKGLSLVLEGQEGHDQDIIRYLDEELKIGHTPLAKKVRTDVQRKSSGIFMWVILVVRILQQEYDDGRKHMLSKRLQETPGDLHELFREILTRDDRNKGELLLCIQWVLFAKELLRPEELYFAMLTDLDPSAVSGWNRAEVETADMKRYILSSSKGLVEVIEEEYSTPAVQFIHESINDFLFKENGIKELWPDLKQNFEGKSHERLKQCCLDYMKISFAGESSEASSVRGDQLNEEFPFLEYACFSVLYHSDDAEGDGVSQTRFLEAFPLTDWIKYHHARGFVECTSQASFLYVLAFNDLANLIEVCPDKLSGLKAERERYGPPLFAALASHSYEAAWALLEAQAAAKPPSSPLHGLCEQYRRENHGKSSFDQYFKFSPQRGLISHLAEKKEKTILTFILLLGDHDYEINMQGDGAETPLVYALRMEDAGEIIQLLIDKGVDVNLPNKYDGKTALWQAVLNGSRDQVEQLLENGAAPNVVDLFTGDTALHCADFHVNKDLVELLLDWGADTNTANNQGRTPLFCAVRDGVTDMVELLIERDAVVNVSDVSGQTPLAHAAALGHREIVKLLLDRGAEIDVADKKGCTPLYYAVKYDHDGVVELLLERGAAPVKVDKSK